MKMKVKLDSENLIELVEQDMQQATDSATAQIYVTAAVAHAILALVAAIKEESNKEKELKNAYFLRDDEQKRNRVLEQKLKEEISKNQILEAVVLEINNVIDGKAGLHTDTARIARIMSVLNRNKGGEGDGSST